MYIVRTCDKNPLNNFKNDNQWTMKWIIKLKCFREKYHFNFMFILHCFQYIEHFFIHRKNAFIVVSSQAGASGNM